MSTNPAQPATPATSAAAAPVGPAQAAPAAPESTTVEPRLTLSGYSRPDLNGQVTFHLPNTYERIAISSRMGELANRVPFDMLPSSAQTHVQMVATLEYVIDTAPKAFYVSDANTGLPMLNFSGVQDAEQECLWAIFGQFMKYHAFTRRGIYAQQASGEPGSAPAVQGG